VEIRNGIHNTHNYARCHARLLGVYAYCGFVLQPMWEDVFLISIISVYFEGHEVISLRKEVLMNTLLQRTCAVTE